MDLTTRCPRCGAIFSASLEQLQLRKGYIRCVECANIFDGYEAVVPGNGASAEASAVAAPTAAPAPAPVPVSAPVASVAATPPRAAPAMPSVLRQRPAKEEPVPAAEPVVPKIAPQSGTGPA